MLVALGELLKDAERNRYAVGSFNTPNLETLRAVRSEEHTSELQSPA